MLLLLAAVVWLVPPFFKGPNFSAADHPYLVWAETYLPTVLFILSLVCAFLGAHFYRRLRRVNRFIELKRREGYEGLLELLNTRDGRKRFDEIRVFSEKTEKEKIK